MMCPNKHPGGAARRTSSWDFLRLAATSPTGWGEVGGGGGGVLGVQHVSLARCGTDPSVSSSQNALCSHSPGENLHLLFCLLSLPPPTHTPRPSVPPSCHLVLLRSAPSPRSSSPLSSRVCAFVRGGGWLHAYINMNDVNLMQ